MSNLILHHTSIPVRDLGVSAEFYEELFGLKRLRRPPFSVDGVWLACGDGQLHLVENPSGTYRSQPAIDIADIHFAFWTDNFKGMVERLKAGGFSETAENGDPKRILVSRNGPAGFPQLYLLDPDFNIVEVNAAPV